MAYSFDLAAVVERLLDDRVRQGLERQCSDPNILGEIVGVLREVDEQGRTKKSARTDAAKHRTLSDQSATT